MRIRITSDAGGMTSSHATGYFTNGEVEDYRILVDDYPLTSGLFTFNVALLNGVHAGLHWQAGEGVPGSGYEIQKSTDGRNWQYVTVQGRNPGAGSTEYRWTDRFIGFGTTFYRIHFIGTGKYSEVRSVQRNALADVVMARPNPARDRVYVDIESGQSSVAEIMLYTFGGKKVFHGKQPVTKGRNVLELNISTGWPDGQYILHIMINNRVYSGKLVVLH
jgi:hypothetical protein